MFSSGEGEGEWEWEEKPGESPLHSSKPASLQRERGGGGGGYMNVTVVCCNMYSYA